jgi:hypothetical protein
MRYVATVAVLGVITASALAGPEVLPVKGMKYATYDMASGELSPTSGPERIGDPVWSSTARSGYFTSITDDGWAVIDWGDAFTPGTGELIGGFAFSYSTGEVLPTRMDPFLAFFAEENGRNSAGRVALAAFQITDLPTGDPLGTFNGWTVTVDLDAAGFAFTIDGSDLDVDGLVDFGYTYWFPLDLDTTGPTIAGDPNITTGIEDAFEAFATTDPNIDPAEYDGSWFFGGVIFAQFYMELFDSDANIGPGCPSGGDSGKFCFADIDGSADCIVDLGDLSQLLANFGTTSGAALGDGDVDPPPPAGDGDVDLGDLAELLSQYLDDCN